ncbi:MAG: ompa/motb domain protein [Cytophagaceae bacterium]|jgi:tetratricopeptide (TPR) repeat protein|nr:ompa/motb domain protein [Cytophagaceae bacterium]
MKVKLLCTLLMIIFLAATLPVVHAQHKNIFTLTQSSFKQAEKFYKQTDYRSAITLYEKALLKDRRRQGLIKLRLANSYRLLHHTKEAEFWYKDIMNTKSLVGQQDVFNYAMILLSNKKYEASKAWFEHYNKEYGADSLVLRKLQGLQQMASYYEDSISRPVAPLVINTSYSEFSPVFYDNGLVFTSSRQTESMIKLNNAKDNKAFLDLYYCPFNTDQTLSEPKSWHHAINSSYHEGPVVFYSNNTKALFTQNISIQKKQEKIDTRHLGLFSIEKQGDHWSEAVPLPFNSTKYSIAHAAITQDGQSLYFTSNKPGGYGGTDLYQSTYNGTTWTEPVNLGSTINTSGNELFPYLFQDSILYFSSTGHAGLGGLDIYRSYPCQAGYCEVENMGYPINSSQDDFGIVFRPDHKSGYLSSNRIHGGSDDDLFSFQIINVYLKGTIKGKLKGLPLADVSISMALKGKEVLSTKTNERGEFLLTLDPSEEYTMTVFKDTYKAYTHTVSTRHRSTTDSILQNILLEKEVKTLVKGVVNQNDSIVTKLKIIALETSSKHQDTLYSDEKGEFFFEADPSLEYYFYVDTKYSFGDVLLEPSKKTKGTFLLYTKIELHNYDTTFVNVLVKDGSVPVANALVVLENTVTEKRDTLYTNKKGMIRFVAKSYADYNIISRYKKKQALLSDFNLLTTRVRTLVLHLKEEKEDNQ